MRHLLGLIFWLLTWVIFFFVCTGSSSSVFLLHQNPGIILPSANLDVTVKECVLGSLSFNGQRCTALKILFVHDSIADVFLAKFAAAVDALKLGLPWDPETKVLCRKRSIRLHTNRMIRILP